MGLKYLFSNCKALTVHPNESNMGENTIQVKTYRFKAHAMEHIHNVFSSNIPRCTMRVRTATQTTD